MPDRVATPGQFDLDQVLAVVLGDVDGRRPVGDGQGLLATLAAERGPVQ